MNPYNDYYNNCGLSSVCVGVTMMINPCRILFHKCETKCIGFLEILVCEDRPLEKVNA